MNVKGEVVSRVKNKLVEFDIYRVKVVGGPCDGMPSLVGNSAILFIQGHRYELNHKGEFVYSPEGLN